MVSLDIFDTSGTQNTTATHGGITMHGFGHNRSDFARLVPNTTPTSDVGTIWTTGNPTNIEDRFDNPRYYKGSENGVVDLTTGLLSYWAFEEASSTRFDSHGSNDLSLIVDAARVLSKDGVNYAINLVRGANNLPSFSPTNGVSPGDSDFTFACWIYLKAANISETQVISGIWVSPANREWKIYYDGAGDGDIKMQISPDGTDSGNGVVSHGTSLSADTWYLVIGSYDSNNDLMKISVDGGDYTTESFADGVYEGLASFVIGADSNLGDQADAYIDEAAFWSRLLNEAEKTALYNGGIPLTYSDL